MIQKQKRLLAALRRRAATSRARLEWLTARRAFRKPFELVHDRQRRLDELSARSGRAIRERVRAARRHLDASTARLESLSPLAVLARGYSVTQRADDGQLIRDAAQLSPGDPINTRVARGEIVSRVEEIHPAPIRPAAQSDGDGHTSVA